jgi:transposase InsO family protein
MKNVPLDNAGDYLLAEFQVFFKTEGILHQTTVPYAHQQNGKAERYIRTLEDGTMTLMADADIPLSYWGIAVRTKQYLLNVTPTSTLPMDVTLQEAFTGVKPDVSHLRVWRCHCWVRIPKEI